MNRLLVFFTIALALASCSLSDKKITQTEFERLLRHDSIESISLNTNDVEMLIPLPFFRQL